MTVRLAWWGVLQVLGPPPAQPRLTEWLPLALVGAAESGAGMGFVSRLGTLQTMRQPGSVGEGDGQPLQVPIVAPEERPGSGRPGSPSCQATPRSGPPCDPPCEKGRVPVEENVPPATDVRGSSRVTEDGPFSEPLGSVEQASMPVGGRSTLV